MTQQCSRFVCVTNGGLLPAISLSACRVERMKPDRTRAYLGTGGPIAASQKLGLIDAQSGVRKEGANIPRLRVGSSLSVSNHAET